MKKLKQLNISDDIINSNKVLDAVTKKLSEELLRYIKVEFAGGYEGHTGYKIKFQYHNDEDIIKEVEIHFRVGNYYDSWVWVKEVTWLKKEDFQREYNPYQQEFKKDENASWEQGQRAVFKQVVAYIVENIQKYYASNIEKFIRSL